MPDDIPITAGSGVNVRADKIADVYTQVVKLSSGADGVEDFLASAANPFPVSLRDATTGSAAQICARVQTPTGPVLQVQIGPGDVISSLPVVVQYEHHQIHEGESYEWFWSSGSAQLNGTKDFRIVVPNVAATTRTPHIVTEIISDAAKTDLYFYEATTWTAGGVDDSARIHNRNRNIATAAGTKIYVAGGTALTVDALGTQFWQGLLFVGKSAATVESRGLSEWDLKANTEYLFRVTTSAAGNVLVRFNFYEDRGV